jgi:hypothetical protein
MGNRKLKKLRESLVGLQVDLAEQKRLGAVKWSPLNASVCLGIEAAIRNVRMAIEGEKQREKERVRNERNETKKQ